MYGFMLPRQTGPTTAEVASRIESSQLPIENRLRSLETACAGLWALLKEKHGYSDDELVRTIEALDAADGSADGRIEKPQTTCPHCGRRQLIRNPVHCAWCGADLPHSPL